MGERLPLDGQARVPGLPPSRFVGWSSCSRCCRPWSPATRPTAGTAPGRQRTASIGWRETRSPDRKMRGQADGAAGAAPGRAPAGLPAEGGGQGGARADLEFGVAARQVVFDGPLGDEQPLGDLAVGEPGGGHVRDPQFAGGERVPPVRGIAAWPAAGDDELAAGPVTKGHTAHGVRQVQALPQPTRAPGYGHHPPALCRAEVDQRAGQVKRRQAPARSTLTASVSSSAPSAPRAHKPARRAARCPARGSAPATGESAISSAHSRSAACLSTSAASDSAAAERHGRIAGLGIPPLLRELPGLQQVLGGLGVVANRCVQASPGMPDQGCAARWESGRRSGPGRRATSARSPARRVPPEHGRRRRR